MNKGYRTFTKALFTLTLALALSAPIAKAQFGDAGEIIRAGAGDASLIMTEYMRPALQGFSTGLNTGWVSTAKTHSLLGFSLTIRANAAVVPSSLMSFNLNDLDLQKTRPVAGANPNASTLFGTGNGTRVELFETVNGVEYTFAEFEIPGGVNFEYVPSAMAQLSVGLIKNTDVTIRYMPTTEVPDVGVNVGMFGIGIKHDILQWIPGGSLIPIDVSFAAGYTSLSAVSSVDVRPSDTNKQGAQPMSQWEDQEISFTASGINYNILVGKTLPFISVYAGVGMETSKSELKATGKFPVESPDPQVGNINNTRYDAIENPLNLSVDGPNGFRTIVGARLKILILTVSAEYVMADMPVYSLGFGISFR